MFRIVFIDDKKKQNENDSDHAANPVRTYEKLMELPQEMWNNVFSFCNMTTAGNAAYIPPFNHMVFNYLQSPISVVHVMSIAHPAKSKILLTEIKRECILTVIDSGLYSTTESFHMISSTGAPVNYSFTRTPITSEFNRAVAAFEEKLFVNFPLPKVVLKDETLTGLAQQFQRIEGISTKAVIKKLTTLTDIKTPIGRLACSMFVKVNRSEKKPESVKSDSEVRTLWSKSRKQK
jgi:hypothetical protein